MKTDEIREKYLEFFTSKGHARRASDVLVPHGDPSVLFTPAGMNQFKDHFLGKVKLDFTRATTCQKCLRTGDIDNVGRTAFHHTFFEMLGNFSFGDYFKREAIHWAWEFLTDKKWMGLDASRLTVSVYLDDDEAAEIWKRDIGLTDDRIARLGEDDNFWPASAPSQGPDGVCGPCSEIFYHDGKGGNVEIWNLVFTQFNRVGEPPDNLRPLPSKNIDTGMGLERIACVMQGHSTNFHIDSLRPIVDAAAEVIGRKYEADSEDGRRLRRITDHVRAATFAIHENVEPDSKKQGYVIRRLLRRAVLDGHQMGMREPFLYQLVEAVVEQMKQPYPELLQTTSRVAEEIKMEERAFLNTLDAGMARIDAIFSEMSKSRRQVVSGDEAENLYTTYGVPPELFQQLAADRGLTFDWVGYKKAMERHGETSGGGAVIEVFKHGALESIKEAVKRTEFLGYETETSEAIVKGIVVGDASVDSVNASDGSAVIVLDRSPFYGESGGQVGDQGTLEAEGGSFSVTDTKKDAELLVHVGQVKSGTIKVGDRVKATVDAARRQGVRRAHSATHLLHHALQQYLGEQAQQRGSKVEADRLRFDFKQRDAIAPEVLEQIEARVRTLVGQASSVETKFLPIEQARQTGAMMLFGEKYPDVVRMVSMGSFSKELCGGTHVASTQEIGPFEIVSEELVSLGTRRIQALTGEQAEEFQASVKQAAAAIAAELGCTVTSIAEGVRRLSDHVRDLRKQLSGGAAAAELVPAAADSGAADYPAIRAALREAARLLNVSVLDAAERVKALKAEAARLVVEIESLASASEISVDELLEGAQRAAGVPVVTVKLPVANANFMRQLVDRIRQKSEDSVVIVGAVDGDRCQLLVGVSKGVVGRVKAGDIVRQVAPVIGGGGGGRPDMAQAGGKDPAKLDEALAAAEKLALETLG